jgi:hypothetical protein
MHIKELKTHMYNTSVTRAVRKTRKIRNVSFVFANQNKKIAEGKNKQEERIR